MDTGNLPPAVAEAFSLFTRKVSRHEHGSPSSTLKQTGVTLEFTRLGGSLRLRWSPDSRALTLEISHGPPTGIAVGWTDLFCATLDGELLLPDQHDFTLGEDLDHGLALMFPEHTS